MLPGGGPRGFIVLAALFLAGLAGMDRLLHRPTRLGRALAAIRQVIQGRSARPAFQAAIGHRDGNDRSGEAAAETGIRVYHAGCQRSLPGCAGRRADSQAGHGVGDRRPECRAGGMGSSVPHIRTYQVSF